MSEEGRGNEYKNDEVRELGKTRCLYALEKRGNRGNRGEETCLKGKKSMEIFFWCSPFTVPHPSVSLSCRCRLLFHRREQDRGKRHLILQQKGKLLGVSVSLLYTLTGTCRGWRRDADVVLFFCYWPERALVVSNDGGGVQVLRTVRVSSATFFPLLLYRAASLFLFLGVSFFYRFIQRGGVHAHSKINKRV